MLGMSKGLIVHNSIQLSIPLWLVPLFFLGIPGLNFGHLAFAAIIGMLIPDVDHFNMLNRVNHKKGIVSFLKFCVQADRQRKVFLPFHTNLSMAIVTALAIVFYFVDIYLSVFFAAFAIHLMSDLVADMYLLKQMRHWRLRNWFDGKNTSLSGQIGMAAPVAASRPKSGRK